MNIFNYDTSASWINFICQLRPSNWVWAGLMLILAEMIALVRSNMTVEESMTHFRDADSEHVEG